MVLHEKRNVDDEDNENINSDVDDTPPFSLTFPLIIDEGNLEESYTWDDHNEKIWVEYPFLRN